MEEVRGMIRGQTVREVKLKAGTGEEKTQVVKDDERGEVSSFDKLSDTEAFLPHD